MPTGDATVIDLGTVRYDRDDTRRRGPAGPPPGTRWGRVSAWPLGLVVAALLVLPMAGAAAPPVGQVERLWSVPIPGPESNTPVAVDDRHLYLAVVDESSGDRNWTLTAYGLGDGRPRWQVPLGVVNSPWLWPAGPTLVVSASGRDGSQATTGYDGATGKPRWVRPWLLRVPVSDDLVLMMGRTFPPERPDDPLGAGMELIPVDPRTGRDAAVTFRVGTDDHLDVRRGSADLFTLARDGTLTRYDLATGRVAATVATPHRERDADASQNGLRVDDGAVLVMARGGATPPAVSAYDADTLMHRWDAPVPAVSAEPCGPVVCVTSRSGGTPVLYGLDPVTGATRWTLPCDGDASVMDCEGPYVRTLPGDRLWVGHRAVASRGEAWERTVGRVVDAATGRVLATARGWGLESEPQGPGLLLSGLEFARDADRQLGDEAEASPVRTWWAHAEADLSGLRVLGTTGAARCRPAWSYLVCETDREVAVWRVAETP